MREVVRPRIASFVDEGAVLGGVVHVGAHDGEEIAYYLTAGLTPVVAFEPHPVPFAELQREYGAPHGVICVPLALGARDGEVTLREPEDGFLKATSALQPIPTEGEAHVWTLVAPGAALTVPLRRMDSWARETGIDLAPFSILVVDVQGMEMDVLLGTGGLLAGFDHLCVECSERPVYEGEAAAGEVIAYLAEQGFETASPVEVHDDVLFRRVRPAPEVVEPDRVPTQVAGTPAGRRSRVGAGGRRGRRAR